MTTFFLHANFMQPNPGKQTSKYYKREIVTLTQSVTGIDRKL